MRDDKTLDMTIAKYTSYFSDWLDEVAAPTERRQVVMLAISQIGIHTKEWADNPQSPSRELMLENLRGLVQQFEEDWKKDNPEPEPPDPGAYGWIVTDCGDLIPGDVPDSLRPGLAGFGED